MSPIHYSDYEDKAEKSLLGTAFHNVHCPHDEIQKPMAWNHSGCACALPHCISAVLLARKAVPCFCRLGARLLCRPRRHLGREVHRILCAWSAVLAYSRTCALFVRWRLLSRQCPLLLRPGLLGTDGRPEAWVQDCSDHWRP